MSQVRSPVTVVLLLALLLGACQSSSRDELLKADDSAVKLRRKAASLCRRDSAKTALESFEVQRQSVFPGQGAKVDGAAVFSGRSRPR